ARGELADAGEQRVRPRHVAVREVIPDRGEVDVARQAAEREQPLDLGGEVQAAARLAKVERLLPEAVAREEQALFPRVPDGEGELAAQALDARRPPALVGTQQHL